jgi:beta-lactamase regulating signal transducer with metallopeptidase domain
MTDTVTQLIGLLVVRSALTGSALVLVTSCALGVAQRSTSASTRHRIWSLTLQGLALLPIGLLIASRAAGDPTMSTASAWSPERSEPEWLAWLGVVWLTGAITTAIWIGIGVRGAMRLACESEPTDNAIMHETLDATIELSGLRRRPELRIVRPGLVPMVLGLRRPLIILPFDATHWHSHTLRSVLLHECAHLARRDGWTQACASFTLVLYWFHPGVWYAVRRMSAEQELSCDDAVLATGVPARAYATHLVELAQLMSGARSSLAAAARGTLSERIPAVLDTTRVRDRLSDRGRGLATIAALAALTVMIIAGTQIRAPEPATAAPSSGAAAWPAP